MSIDTLNRFHAADGSNNQCLGSTMFLVKSDSSFMPIINTSVEIGKYVNDKNRIIPKAHLDIVCQRSRGSSACRYLCSLDPLESEAREFICMKNTPVKSIIDKEALNPSFKAKGDNCDGFGELNDKEEKEHQGRYE